MEGVAAIKFGSGFGTVVLSPLQCAELAASKCGYFDVDLKDNDPGSYTLVAYNHSSSVTARGKSLDEAVERLLFALGFK